MDVHARNIGCLCATSASFNSCKYCTLSFYILLPAQVFCNGPRWAFHRTRALKRLNHQLALILFELGVTAYMVELVAQAILTRIASVCNDIRSRNRVNHFTITALGSG